MSPAQLVYKNDADLYNANLYDQALLYVRAR